MPSAPQLRFLYKASAVRGLRYAIGVSSLVTVLVTAYVYNKKVVSVRKFYESYDPDLEWERLLKSGLLKSVEPDGTRKNFFE